MRKPTLLMNLISFPIPVRFLPAVFYGVLGTVGAFMLYLLATRGL